MGYPMAGHLVRAGHDVTVYNRTVATADRWVRDHGGRSATTPAAAAEGAEFVFFCVGADDDVREVLLGRDGAVAALDTGAVVVDHTTASASLAEPRFNLADDPYYTDGLRLFAELTGTTTVPIEDVEFLDWQRSLDPVATSRDDAQNPAKETSNGEN